MEILDGLEHVFTETVFIRKRRVLFEDAAFDAAAEVFGEVAVDLGIDLADDALGIDLDASFARGGLGLEEERGRDKRCMERAAGKRGVRHGSKESPGRAFIPCAEAASQCKMEALAL